MNIVHKYMFSFLVVVLIGIGWGCSSAAKVLKQPLPEIVGTTARDGVPGQDYTVWIDCTARNKWC